VRAIRHESYDTSNIFKRERALAIDVVHQEFLEKYVSSELAPFAQAFGDRVSHSKTCCSVLRASLGASARIRLQAFMSGLDGSRNKRRAGTRRRPARQ
jgi:hypothetical protein